MSKAEERAREAYPPTFIDFNRKAKRIQSNKVDTHAPVRNIYIKGYHQAEKDSELTWEDIQLIVSIDWDLDHSEFSCGKSTEEYYKEVLKQFNEERNNYGNN